MSDALKRTFLMDIYPLNKLGNVDFDFAAFSKLINSNIKDNDGNIITPELFKNKYKQYCEWWNAIYASKQKAGFLKEKDEKRTIKQFIEYQYYLKTFELDPTSRDYYLFGGMTDEELRKAIKIFKEDIFSGR